MVGGRRTAAVIGGGPAGLMAAEVLAGAGLAVTVYERMPSVARKLLMAGRGGLNLTHAEALPAFLDRYGAHRASLQALIEHFPPTALRAWAHDLGQETFEGTSGRVFPRSMKASPLLRAWLRRLDGLGVVVQSRHCWQGWDAGGASLFERTAEPPLAVRADVTILAMGGASWPRLGGDGRWVAPLSGAGVSVAPLVAANTSALIGWSRVFLDRFEGAPLKRIVVTCDGASRQGEAVVTRAGLEGGAIYALGPAIRAALAREGVARLTLDVRPGLSLAELTARLEAPRGKQSASNFLRKAAGLAPVAIGLVREGTGGQLPQEAAAIARAIKAVPLTVIGQGGLERAISSAGGVRFESVDGRLMLRARPGVFVAGEMLDWEAPTGGYLLQATFATAVHAARGAITWLACDERAR